MAYLLLHYPVIDYVEEFFDEEDIGAPDAGGAEGATRAVYGYGRERSGVISDDC